MSRVDSEAIINDADIVAIIDSFVPLTKVGSLYRALCPFHDEKTPSFEVVPSKRIYKCMGCGKGGDVIDFVQSFKHIGFREACEVIKSGKPVPMIGSDEAPTPAKPKSEWKAITPPAAPQSFTHFKNGDPAAIYPYKSVEGLLLGFTCRFNLPNGEKEVLPYFFCTNGSRSEWRWNGPQKPKPLYGAERLAALPKAAVFIVEGEKTCDALQAIAPHIVVVTWMGGANGTAVADWSVLKGRRIIIWPDNDWQGMAAAIQIAHYVGGARIVQNPPQEKGWDFADSGWDLSTTQEWIKGNLMDMPHSDPAPDWAEPSDAHWLIRNPDGTPARHLFKRGDRFVGQRVPQPIEVHQEPPAVIDPPYFGDDDAPPPMHHNDAPFSILGFEKLDLGRVAYIFYDKAKRVVIRKSTSELTKSAFIELADLSFWEDRFQGSRSGKIDEDMARNWIIREASKRLFSAKLVRGRGAWIDAGRVVVHAGDKLIVNGHHMSLGKIDTSYIYEVSDPLNMSMENPMAAARNNALIDVCKRLPWERDVNALLLAGWCVVAPVCGALKWRPHIWITGGAGTGKSSIMRSIVRQMLGETALQVQGDTTEAGLRQTLGLDAMPVVFDEAEPHDPEANRRIQAVLSLMRSASTSDSGEIIKGTASHAAKTFRISSCFAMASISVAVDKKSDRSRVTILGLNTKHKMTLDELNKQYSRITPELVQGIQARTLNMLPVIIHNSATFATAAAQVLGEQRIGDQLGPMLAGAYALTSDNMVSYENALKWVQEQEWTEEREVDAGSDEYALLQYIYNQHIRVQVHGGYVETTVTEAIEIASGRVQDDNLGSERAADNLKRIGILAFEDQLIISNTHEWLRRILKETQWAKNHHKILKRLPGATSIGPIRFSGQSQARAIAIPMVANKG
jgi:putative DNA primase/helicase